MTVQCCKCRKVRVDGRWVAASVKCDDPVSHTYCPKCFIVTMCEVFAFDAGTTPRHSATVVTELVRRNATSS